tara:strand:+ start:795 stop:977 length:183 start_codon:yes stop_codon:yes gene_type:complete
MIQLTDQNKKPIFINAQKVCYVGIDDCGGTYIQMENTHLFVLEILDTVLDKLEHFLGSTK